MPIVISHKRFFSAKLWLQWRLINLNSIGFKKNNTKERENALMPKTWNLIQEALLSDFILFQSQDFFVYQQDARGLRGMFYAWTHLIWWANYCQVVLPGVISKASSGDAGVFELKSYEDRSLCLIIKSRIMIALCEDVSQMYYYVVNIVKVCDQQREIERVTSAWMRWFLD